jgi:hypothetical protein
MDDPEHLAGHAAMGTRALQSMSAGDGFRRLARSMLCGSPFKAA